MSRTYFCFASTMTRCTPKKLRCVWSTRVLSPALIMLANIIAPIPKPKYTGRLRKLKQSRTDNPNGRPALSQLGFDPNQCKMDVDPTTSNPTPHGSRKSSQRAICFVSPMSEAGRRKQARAKTIGYSINESKIIGATKVLNKPPRTPPAEIHSRTL